MIKSGRFIVIASIWIMILPSLGYAPVITSSAEKMTAKDLLSMHLLAIGTPEAREAIRNRIMDGKAEVYFKQGGFGRQVGVSSFISEGRKVRLALLFNSLSFPGEQFVYNGDLVSVGSIRPGDRSSLAGFINDHGTVLVEDGFLGGVTSTNWCLLEARSPRVEYLGIKKVDGRQLHGLRYHIKNNGFKIDFFFEPDTYRHVQTQYTFTIKSPFAANSPADETDTFWKLKEEFSNFNEVNGITLPLSYKLTLTYEGVNSSIFVGYSADFNRVRHNQPLDSATFTIH